jgi:hypothetical protein
MAEQLNEKKVQMGVVIPVKNLNPAVSASANYFAVKLEDETGAEDNECWVLLTTRELYQHVPYNCGKWGEDLKRGRTYECSCRTDKVSRCLIKLDRPRFGTSSDYETVILRVSENWLKKGLARAAKNPEDIPNEGWWEDLKD